MKSLNKLSIRIILTIISSIIYSLNIIIFIRPINTLPGGVTGLSFLLNMILEPIGITISSSMWIIILNLPVAILCYKAISKKFVFLSLIHVSMVSFLLGNLKLDNIVIFDDIILNVVFGGFLTGISVLIALKANSSTGGSDFIAMYISNIKGKSIFTHVFIFNVIIFIILGFKHDFNATGYSVLINLISTSTINYFYRRYAQVTLLITTSKAKEIIKAYTSETRHGITVLNGYGGYSNKEVSILHTVVSKSEAGEIVHLMRKIDENIIVNSLKTEKFYGRFYRNPID